MNPMHQYSKGVVND